ncbi:hypothetical protein SOVF_109300 [Spinacia oleracea]|uniref:Uncharacterized protein n=1 Tax=Spinacia oleracea TaxID=3562 RepID=A0A9R0IUE2_SPIOL|nr:uncharacterized protein LOC110794878 [Spinacia oleracea]KNA14235.1 hypothetical protein SOVF_109300 [Spinacia oleracea]
MAGGGFLGRVISYVANQLIVDGLANSHAFQRFAVRTNNKIKNISKLAEEKKMDIAEQLKEIKQTMKQ